MVHEHPSLRRPLGTFEEVFGAPYWSVDGPMEYILNTIHTNLSKHFHGIDSLDELGILLDIVIAQLNGFLKYFLHVGFTNN